MPTVYPLCALLGLLTLGFCRILSLWPLLYFSYLHPALPLVFYYTSLLLLSYYIMSILYLILLTIYLPAFVYLCSRHSFQCMFMIRIYRYTCVYLCTLFASPLAGEFWLPWILMSRSQSLELVDSSRCWSEMRSWSVNHRQAVQSPSFQASCASLEFFFCKLVSALFTIHTCISLCILTFTPIDDVILL